MTPIPKVCLSCGKSQTDGSRCASCNSKHETQRLSKRIRPHYDYRYRKASAIVRRNAERCWLCGDGYKSDDPWTADHVLPGDPNSPLLPAHRSCNSRRGNRPADPYTDP